MPARSALHLAQVNIALPRAPVDAPELAEFMALLDPINELADRSPGFVWRLQTESGNATAIRPFDDHRLMVNLSVWESLEALRDFVYASRHLDVMRRRRDWFHRMAGTYLALWWLPAGTLPTVEEAKERLARLRRDGPGPDAFTFRQPFPPPGRGPRGDLDGEGRGTGGLGSAAGAGDPGLDAGAGEAATGTGRAAARAQRPRRADLAAAARRPNSSS
ncbi:MAG TPA: DUF3291 domain-containing protein [Actinomycetes bacterium]